MVSILWAVNNTVAVGQCHCTVTVALQPEANAEYLGNIVKYFENIGEARYIGRPRSLIIAEARASPASYGSTRLLGGAIQHPQALEEVATF